MWKSISVQVWSEASEFCASSAVKREWRNLLTCRLEGETNDCCHCCAYLRVSSLVVSDSLQLHRLQHDRLPCPSPATGACSNSCPSSWWCHQTNSSSVIPFSSHLQSFPGSECFLLSRFFTSGGQIIGVSALASVLPVNIQDWFPLGWMDWLDLLVVQGTLKSLLQHHSLKASILWCSAFCMIQLSHPYMTTGKTIALTITDLCWQRNVSAF